MSLLENKHPENHLLLGEELLDNNAITEAVEIEPKLWSIMIKDNGIIEVEIQNPNTKSQKCTCECKTFIKEKSCPHLVASLLHLRRIENSNSVAKKKKNIANQKATFNIKTILNNIDTEQLKNYVRSYAQKDRNFSIMLKATFAKSIDLNDNLLKYQTILSSLIKPISTERLKSTSADLRLALKVIDEFNAQLEDCMSIAQYEDAFIILQATLPKLHYQYAMYTFQKEKTGVFIARFHNHLNLLYQEKLAPDFKERMDTFIIDLSQKSFYNHLQNALSLFQILARHNREKPKNQLIKQYQNQDISSIKEESKVVFGALLIIIKSYDNLNINNDQIIKSINYLINSDNEKEAIEYLEYFLSKEHRNRKMETTLIDIYQNQGSLQKFQKLAIKLFVKQADIKYYRKLKDHTPEDQWTNVKQNISQAIKEYTPTSSLLAIYYSNEMMYDKLIILLEEELDLRHIMKYDFILYKSNFLDIERIYHKAITNYLDQHVGTIASSFINEILNHVSRINAFKLEQSLKKHIQNNYPHRKIFTSYS